MLTFQSLVSQGKTYLKESKRAENWGLINSLAGMGEGNCKHVLKPQETLLGYHRTRFQGLPFHLEFYTLKNQCPSLVLEGLLLKVAAGAPLTLNHHNKQESRASENKTYFQITVSNELSRRGV